MKDIYSQSERVLIWLGEDYCSANAAMKSIRRIVDQCKEVIMQSMGHFKEHSHTCDKERITASLYQMLYNERRFDLPHISLTDCEWHLVLAFFSTPWLTRLWVVQEVVLSQEAFCYQGDACITWDDIELAAMWMQSLHYPRQLRVPNSRGIMNASAIWILRKIDIYISTYLIYATDFDTTEPLDKIYGLLGLLQRSSRSNRVFEELLPDYNKRVEDLFTTVTRLCIQKQAKSTGRNSLTLLEHAQSVSRLMGENKWDVPTPSWVLRYNLELDPIQIIRLDCRWVRASANYVSLEQVDNNPRILRILGVMVDRVHRFGPEFLPTKTDSQLPLVVSVLSSLAMISDYDLPDLDIAVTLTHSMIDTRTSGTDDPRILRQFRSYIDICQQIVNRVEYAEPVSISIDLLSHATEACEYIFAMWKGSQRRRLFVTSTGYIGMGPSDLQEDDGVVILFGGSFPFLLRQEGEFSRLLDAVYVHGIMEVS